MVPPFFAERPTGITILAVLQVLGGLAFLGFGALLMVVSGFIGSAAFFENMPVTPRLVGGLAAGVLGIITIFLGLLSFAVSYGYWYGLKWAWALGMGISIISLLISLVSGNVLGIFIDALIIYYLTRPYVKSFFGRETRQFTI